MKSFQWEVETPSKLRMEPLYPGQACNHLHTGVEREREERNVFGELPRESTQPGPVRMSSDSLTYTSCSILTWVNETVS